MSKIIELKQRGSRAKLRTAQEQSALVRVWRSHLEAASFTGYVAGMGKEFFLMWVLADYIGFDGLYALRYKDLTEVEIPEKSQRFLQQAMAIRGLKPEWPADFALDGVEEVVSSANRHAQVIAVHVDTEDKEEVCYVGRLVEFQADGFSLQEITPDAEWLHENSFFGFDEVSAIGLRGPYHEILAQVAGEPGIGLNALLRDHGYIN